MNKHSFNWLVLFIEDELEVTISPFPYSISENDSWPPGDTAAPTLQMLVTKKMEDIM
jgi:hypothetical protein